MGDTWIFPAAFDLLMMLYASVSSTRQVLFFSLIISGFYCSEQIVYPNCRDHKAVRNALLVELLSVAHTPVYRLGQWELMWTLTSFRERTNFVGVHFGGSNGSQIIFILLHIPLCCCYGFLFSFLNFFLHFWERFWQMVPQPQAFFSPWFSNCQNNLTLLFPNHSLSFCSQCLIFLRIFFFFLPSFFGKRKERLCPQLSMPSPFRKPCILSLLPVKRKAARPFVMGKR